VSLRFALLQIALATVAVGLLVVFLTPAEFHAGLMSAAITIALLLAAIQLFNAWRESHKPHNVWLDDAGLHWLDAQGSEQMLPRELARGYLIGRDAETRRDLPSLTFVLEGGFVSQPVEIHAPADQASVRRCLSERWSLAEAEAPAVRRLPLAIYSELDFQRQKWLLQGECHEFQALASAWLQAAELPLSPTGARPLQVEYAFDGDPITLAVSTHTWLDDGYFSVSPQTLRRLADEIGRRVSGSTAPTTFEIPLAMDSGHQWRMLCDMSADASNSPAEVTLNRPSDPTES
jgi:hypothetical protein